MDATVSRDDSLDDADYQVREVYAQYGLTSFMSQVVEKGMVNAICVVATSRSGEPTPEEWDRHFHKYAALTFGRLLAEFEKIFYPETAIIAILRRALPRRNHITHNFFWDQAATFGTVTGRESMLTTLASDLVLFENANRMVDELVRRIFTSGELDEARFDALIAESMQRLREDLPE